MGSVVLCSSVVPDKLVIDEKSLYSAADTEALTGIRGAAALLVLLYHVPWLAGVQAEASPAIYPLKAMDCGVGIFFALSSFLLSRQLWSRWLKEGSNKGAFETFLIRRICRIFPAYLLVVAVTLLPDNRTWTFWGAVNLIAHAFALQTHLHVNFLWQINNVLWTISVEVQFYLILCFVFWLGEKLASRDGSSRFLPLLIMIIAFCFANTIYTACIKLVAPFVPVPIFGGANADSEVYTWNVFYFLKWFAPGIFAGWLSCVCPYRSWTCWNLSAVAKEGGFIVALVAIMFLIGKSNEADWRTVSLWGWPLNAISYSTLIYLAPVTRFGRVLFGNRILIFAGTLSYGIYLWHYPLIRAIGAGSLKDMISGVGLVFALAAVGLLVTATVSYLCFKLVEAPAIEAGRKIHSLGALVASVRDRLSS